MSEVEPPELSRGLALAWGIAVNPQRGPKREMSIERIVETAVELADVEGLGAVSMAAVAAKLGFTPMSLYRYVSAKDDLLLLMQEEVAGIPPEAFREQEKWQAKLRVLFEALVMIYIRHPWLGSLPITGAPVTPSSSAWINAGLEALQDTPLSYEERLAVILTITGQARWYGTVLAGYSSKSRNTGLSAAQITEQEAELFDQVISAEEYPALRQAIEAGVFRSEDDPFRFAIERILDGVEVYIGKLQRKKKHDAAKPWLALDPAEVANDKRYREAQKAVREAEKTLADARKAERQVLREAHARLAKAKQS